MDNEKTRKVGIEAFINSTAISSKISDAAMGLSKAANAAMNGDKRMREYEHALRAATCVDAAYQAAIGLREAGYSEARRAAEMTRAALIPNFTEHLTRFKDIGQQLWEMSTGRAVLLEMDHVKQLREMSKSFQPSLTFNPLPALQEDFHKAFGLSQAFNEANLARLDALEETLRGSLTPSEPERLEHLNAFLPPPSRQENANAANQFMTSFKHQYDEAVERAKEEGGEVVVISKTPTGDVILVKQLSSLDQHFIEVTGVDQHNQPRSFKANCAGLALQIEVVPIPEELEDQSDQDEDLVN